MNGDQVKGEEQITQAIAKRPMDFWSWTAAGRAYLGVLQSLKGGLADGLPLLDPTNLQNRKPLS